ncbi:hypothetical protein PDJAM_G00146480 [Pangasius djambal]|uniref:Uncharacterized protein n=1 Tax=Pangasius djambal TaxID=1691987 RepID=A0ACC5ZHR8_9TELE|nr:hypothetical protein [Pangasius djambal]
MSTARALQNDLEQATGVNVFDQTIRNRLHEGGLRARHPLVDRVLTARHRGARLAFAIEHQNWQHDRFGGGSVMVWGGISMEEHTDLYRLDNGTLTAIRYRDEILGPIVRPYAGAVGPGFLLVHDNAQPHVARVCRQFLEDEGIDTIEWPQRSPDLNPIEHLWDIMFRSIGHRQLAPQTVQELSDARVQIWEEIPQDTIRRLIRSMPLTLSGMHTSTVPGDLLTAVLSVAAQTEEGWNALCDSYIHSIYDSEKRRTLEALASTQDIRKIAWLLKAGLDGSPIQTPELPLVINRVSRHFAGYLYAWDFVKENWDKLTEKFPIGSFPLQNIIMSATSQFSTKTHLEEVESFFGSLKKRGSQMRSVQEAIENIQLNMFWVEKNLDTLRKWL